MFGAWRSPQLLDNSTFISAYLSQKISLTKCMLQCAGMFYVGESPRINDNFAFKWKQIQACQMMIIANICAWQCLGCSTYGSLQSWLITLRSHQYRYVNRHETYLYTAIICWDVLSTDVAKADWEFCVHIQKKLPGESTLRQYVCCNALGCSMWPQQIDNFVFVWKQ